MMKSIKSVSFFYKLDIFVF